MARVAELLAVARSLSGDEGPREAEVLLCAALDKPRSYLFAWPEANVDPEAERRFKAYLQERERGVPVAYLLGRREFWGLDLQVSDATLIPRADTETLVEAALSLPLQKEAIRALDLGTGSGAIALALASERPSWSITGTDVSAETLAVAQRNAAELSLANTRWLGGSWFAPVAGELFDLIVSNPPYLAEDDPHLQSGDLRFEPQAALIADSNGYADLETIIESAADYLAQEGWLVLEHGMEQGACVRERRASAGFERVGSRCDLSGLERVSLGRRKDS